MGVGDGSKLSSGKLLLIFFFVLSSVISAVPEAYRTLGFVFKHELNTTSFGNLCSKIVKTNFSPQV